MIRIVVISLLTAYSLSMILTQGQVVQQAPCSNGSILQMDLKTQEHIAKFLGNLQAALAADDRERVATMVRFPLRVTSMHATDVVQTKEQFIRRYDVIFTSKIKEVVMAQRVGCVNVFSQGFMIHTGEVWFGPSGTGKTIKVISITPPIPPE